MQVVAADNSHMATIITGGVVPTPASGLMQPWFICWLTH